MHKILWVCSSREAIMLRREQLGYNGAIRFIDVGESLIGRSFDEIILDDVRAAPLSPKIHTLREQWLAQIHTNLRSEGQIKTLTVLHLERP